MSIFRAGSLNEQGDSRQGMTSASADLLGGLSATSEGAPYVVQSWLSSRVVRWVKARLSLA